jgi:AcrR family transcriptional regulator
MPKKVDLKKRHEDLARAAVLAICKNGLNDVTLASVAKESGWSIGALTHYIKSKDELLMMAAEYANRELLQRMQPIRAKYKGLEALRHAAYLALPYNQQIPGIRNIWFGFWDRSRKNERVRVMIMASNDASRKRCGEYIKEAQELGELPENVDVAKISRSGLMLLEGINVHCFMTNKPLSKRAQREHVDDWIRQLQLLHPVKK